MSVYIVQVSADPNNLTYEATCTSFVTARSFIEGKLLEQRNARKNNISHIVWFDEEHAELISTGMSILIASISFSDMTNWSKTGRLTYDYYVMRDEVRGTGIEALAEC